MGWYRGEGSGRVAAVEGREGRHLPRQVPKIGSKMGHLFSESDLGTSNGTLRVHMVPFVRMSLEFCFFGHNPLLRMFH